MTKIYTGATMSLDGYIAGPGDSGFDLLFQWYGNGDVEIPTATPDMTFKVTEASAAYIREQFELVGALVVGRHLFDITNGWNGRHPLAVPFVVLTHSIPDGWERESDAWAFVTEGGIEAAVAKARELAGDKAVAVNGGQMARQALEAGLIDEVWVDLAPFLLGDGVPFFDHVKGPVTLEGPISVIEGEAVTHLRYRVARQ